ncbi:hypothetical protein [Bacillus sp. SM2101]|uniref:hypothetical protein n=1 Tax=Bacillus sp. SM2101 TaxID=2805366 RepID=UPI001BDEECB2|nr:hypothetical protein [Bacillus sp. SM2101]
MNMNNTNEYLLFGVGYTLLKDDQVIEVRSLSREVHKIHDNSDILPPHHNPEIKKHDDREIKLSDILDKELIKKIQKGFFYREWILEKGDFERFLKIPSLMEIDLGELNKYKIRKFN